MRFLPALSNAVTGYLPMHPRESRRGHSIIRHPCSSRPKLRFADVARFFSRSTLSHRHNRPNRPQLQSRLPDKEKMFDIGIWYSYRSQYAFEMLKIQEI